MKRSLEAEKVEKVTAKVLASEVSSVLKTRDEIDRAARDKPPPPSNIPKTIKVEKAPPVAMATLNSKREEELRSIEIKKTDAAPSMLTAMAIKKKTPDQAANEMENLIKRRQAEMQNIQYK